MQSERIAEAEDPQRTFRLFFFWMGGFGISPVLGCAQRQSSAICNQLSLSLSFAKEAHAGMNDGALDRSIAVERWFCHLEPRTLAMQFLALTGETTISRTATV